MSPQSHQADSTLGRRKARELHPKRASISTPVTSINKTEAQIPCWIEDEQTISVVPDPIAKTLHGTGNPLISRPARSIIFPLTPDHLITLLQFNVIRACVVNRRLLLPLSMAFDSKCSSDALHVLPSPSTPQSLPWSLHPTVLQRTVPHEEWIDIIPHPR